MFLGAGGKRQRTAELRLFHAEHPDRYPEHRAARLEQKAAAEGGGGGVRVVRRGGDGKRAGEDSSEESWAGSAGSSDESEEEDQWPYAVALRKLGRASTIEPAGGPSTLEPEPTGHTEWSRRARRRGLGV
jgi:hypothetical protein